MQPGYILQFKVEKWFAAAADSVFYRQIQSLASFSAVDRRWL